MDKPINEMTLDEIEQRAAELERLAAEHRQHAAELRRFKRDRK
jgi:hypothetical protein